MIVKRNSNTAELVGLSFGDGGLTFRKNSKRVKFQIRGDLREEKDNYDKYIAPLFNKEFMLPIFKRKVGFVYNLKKNFYGISVESIRIEKPLNYLGIPSGVKKELIIPNWIKKNSRFAKRFLRGLFDTDGTIFCQRNYSIKNNLYHTQVKIGITSTSRKLINGISKLLKTLNFKFVLIGRKSHIGIDGLKRRNSYTIRIDGSIQVNKWFREVGSKSKKHVTKYLVWKKFGFCPPKTTLNDRKKMLKNKLNPHNYYMQVCQSGQMDAVKAGVT